MIKVLIILDIGEGNYKVSDNTIVNLNYSTWLSMLKRCYNIEFQFKHSSYIGCSVHEDWHNFQNFAKWYDENYYSIGNERIALDKDILVKGNKIYSPETCIFVPHNINNLFTKGNIK